jgi:hypothetical protein
MRAFQIALMLPVLAMAGPAPKEESKGKDEPAAERIKRALDKVMDIDIENQSLQLALNQLKEQTKINFVLDRQTAAMMGVDTDNTPVNLKASKKKLRVHLRGLLTPYNLSFGIVGDTVLISTEDMIVHRQLKQRVDLDFEKVPLSTALKQLARDSGVNLLVDGRSQKDGQTPVTLQVEDIGLDAAVRLLAEMAGLKPVRVGNVLFVTTKQSAQEMRGEPDLAPNPMPRVSPDGAQFILNGLGGLVAPPAVPVPAGVPAAPAEAPKPADKKDEEKKEEKKEDKN